MRGKIPVGLKKPQEFLAMMIVAAGIVGNGHQASALTADDVLNKMTPGDSASYVNGVVEGLATARWYKDQPNADGMNCIYGWYYQEPPGTAWKQVLEWFNRHPDQQVGALMHVLIKKECGE